MNALLGLARRALSQRPRRLCVALGIVLAGAAGAQATHAQMQASEVQIKAAFIYNFALFTTWPADAIQADAPMVLCVNAEPPLQAALEKLTGKPVRGHRLEIRKINDGTVAGCHVLVLDARASGSVRVDPVAPVLTIADVRKGTRNPDGQAPMITLTLQEDRVVFYIDAVAARQASLQISSQLLRLARNAQ